MGVARFEEEFSLLFPKDRCGVRRKEKKLRKKRAKRCEKPPKQQQPKKKKKAASHLPLSLYDVSLAKHSCNYQKGPAIYSSIWVKPEA